MRRGFLEKILRVRKRPLSILLLSMALAGCADIGRLGAKTSGLDVVGADGCSYTNPKAPCAAREVKK